MEIPYTNQPTEALVAAQSSVAAVLTSVVWWRPLRPVVSSVALIAAIWIAALSPLAPEVLNGFGLHPDRAVPLLLEIGATLATIAMALNRPRWIGILAFAAQLGLSALGEFLVDSDNELAALHLLFLGVLVGVHLRENFPELIAHEAPSPARSYARRDAVLFACATALALLVALFVLQLGMDSADESAYQYQAELFAHFKAYAPVPLCPEPHRNHWVFYYEGRAFAQYLPGWPLAMAPFVRMHVPWLAGPVSFGAMIMGVARLGRRARGPAAGTIAALAAMLGTSTLLNAGSRYLHCYLVMLYVWMLESTFRLTDVDLGRRGQWGYGAVLGLSSGLLICTRPSDAALLACGLFVYFVVALVRGRIGWRALTSAATTFAIISGLTLVILRLQLGVWFKTGYSIAPLYYDWAMLRWSIPTRDAWRFGVPLATMAYCFFPAAAAIGAAGLVLLGRRITFTLVLGTFALLAFYTYLEFGRYRDFGYGPRFHMPLIVPMAIGSGVLLAPLWTALRRRVSALDAQAAGPAAVAFAALIAGVVRLAPPMYGPAHALLHRHTALFRAIARDGLKNAVVTVASGDTGGGPLLDTQNDPTDPTPKVIILSPADLSCTRKLYEGRTFYRATGQEEVTLTPY